MVLITPHGTPECCSLSTHSAAECAASTASSSIACLQPETPSKGAATKTCAVKFLVAHSGDARPARGPRSADVICQTRTPPQELASRSQCHSHDLDAAA